MKIKILASVALVLAVLFMVGCGTSAEDKKLIQDQAQKIQALEKSKADLENTVGKMSKKLGEVDDFLKKQNPGKYGEQPAETPATPPPAGKTPTKVTNPGKTK